MLTNILRISNNFVLKVLVKVQVLNYISFLTFRKISRDVKIVRWPITIISWEHKINWSYSISHLFSSY